MIVARLLILVGLIGLALALRAPASRQTAFPLMDGVSIAAGVLISSSSGLCTVAYSVAELTAPTHLPNGAVALFTGPPMIIFAVPFGGIPILFGALLIGLGHRSLSRRSARWVGLILTVVGGLVATISAAVALGMCLYMISESVRSGNLLSSAAGILIAMAFVGGPSVLGVGLMMFGRRIFVASRV